MVSDKEIEAAREVLEHYVYDEGGCEVERVPAMVREMLEAAARVRAEGNAEGVPGCMDCGLPYIDDRFQDLFVPNHVWQKIAPDDGLLCPNCLCGRAAKLGIECQATFHSGPFRTHPAPQPSGMVKALEWKKPKELRFRAACTHFGYEYFIDQTPNGWLLQTYLFGDEYWETLGSYPALDDAMYAAQADYERRILSAITAGKPEQAVPSAWQPIETAPKDGTWIIAHRPNKGVGYLDRVVVVRWENEVSAWVWPDKPFDIYDEDLSERVYADSWADQISLFEDNSFTHWLPLPTPPTAGGDDE